MIDPQHVEPSAADESVAPVSIKIRRVDGSVQITLPGVDERVLWDAQHRCV